MEVSVSRGEAGVAKRGLNGSESVGGEEEVQGRDTGKVIGKDGPMSGLGRVPLPGWQREHISLGSNLLHPWQL